MKTLSTILKEFIELFGDGNGGIIGREIIINNFLTTSLKELLEQVLPEEIRDCSELENNGHCGHFHGDDRAFNRFRQEVEDRIKNILNN